jgi:hypothetical protein
VDITKIAGHKSLLIGIRELEEKEVSMFNGFITTDYKSTL